MKTVVVGGHSRKIGKTSLMVGLIRELKSFHWTAVKITQHCPGVSSPGKKADDSTPTERTVVLSEENNPHGRGDTSRFLAAGAKRSLWLRVQRGHLAQAYPMLVEALCGDEFVMIESNSILDFLSPVAYVVVLDGLKRDFKTSARRFLERADALVPVESGLGNRPWPAVNPRGLPKKPVFAVSHRDYFNPELCRFIQQKLDLADGELCSEGPSNLSGR